MTLWIILTTITAIVAVGAAVPFLQRNSGDDASSADVKSSAVYRDQLRQIDAEFQAGSIDEAEAQSTRTELARRLILAEREEKAQISPASAGDRTFAAVGIAAAVALGSAVLYTGIGQPDRIPAPRTAGNVPAGNMGSAPARHPAITNDATARSSGAGEPAGEGQSSGLPTVNEMIDRLVTKLSASPEDANGWSMLGWSYASQGSFNEALAAYDKAIKLQPENAELYATRGEVLVRAGNGVVAADAAASFEETVKRDKQNPRARFYLGLKKLQDGDAKTALDDWISILKGASPDDPWAPDLRLRIEALAAELKVDVTAQLPSSAAVAAPAAPTMPAPPAPQLGGNGPGILGSLQDKAAGATSPQAGVAEPGSAAPVSPGDQYAMIRGMVDGLAARLEKEPRDAQGWGRLIRSRVVMGEPDKAKAALAKARETFADSPDVLEAIGAIARELKLEP